MDIQKDYTCLEHNIKVWSKQVELESDYQEALPAYCDDIYRVVKCTGRSYITSAELNLNEIKVFGKVELCLTYFNENASLCYADFEEDFVKTVSAEGFSDAALLCADVYDKYTNYRVINQRRIDIHNSSAICLEVYDKEKCPSVCSCENSKLKCESVTLAGIVNTNVSRIEFDEEMSLPSGNEAIKRIVSYSSFAALDEIKIIKDKALIKATLTVQILYTADNQQESPERVEYTFNVSKIVDAVGIREDDIPVASVSVGSLFVKAKSSSGERINIVDIFGELTVNTVFIREQEQEMITDGYIPGYTTECTYSDYQGYRAGRLLNEKKTVNMSFSTPDDIGRVLEISLSLGKVTTKNGKISVIATMDAIIQTTGGEVSSFSASDDVELDIDEECDAIASVNIAAFDYSLTSDNTLDIRAVLLISAYTYHRQNFRILSDLNLQDLPVAMPSLTIYFGKANEQVWDIAKRFSSDTETIKNENSINSDSLEANQVLIIPRA